jgi:ABC-2 type transport system permease protein
MRSIRYIALKEVRHILRDPKSLMIAILMPLLMILLYGYAINLDIKNIKIAIIDYDNTVGSRELASRFYNSGYFARPDAVPALSDPETVLRRSQAHAILTIKPGFGAALEQLIPFELGLMLDGADANTATAAASYAEIVLQSMLEDRFPPGFEVPGVRLSQQVLYNPDLKSSHFFVLGLIAVILMLVSALLTSLTIAREKETGTLEQLLTAPVKPWQIIIGKIIPYIGLAGVDGLIVWAFAVFHFGVPVAGSMALLAFFAVIFIVAALSIGILVSTVARTQQVAMTITLTVTMMPSVLLSGFAFEIKNMPRFLQLITMIVPARYFITIVRGVMLKGSGLATLWPQAVGLGIISLGLLGLAAKRFKMRIG